MSRSPETASPVLAARRINISPIVSVTGALLSALGVMMLIPALADLAFGDPHWIPFVISGLLTAYIGVSQWLAGRTSRNEILTVRDVFLLTTIAWSVSCLFAAAPLSVAVEGLGFTRALFEATSGLTATGATALTQIDRLPHSVHLWRAIMQWYGGIGIIVLGIAILPSLQIGGMQLFRSESSDQSEKILPRAGTIAMSILGIYSLLTLICAILYALGGMSVFDAVVHALTTVATGGFSSHDASLGHFSNPQIHWTAIVFMISGALPFSLYIALANGRYRALFTDEQIGFFFLLLGGFCAIALVNAFWGQLASGSQVSVTQVVFLVVAILTTTGYAATDYSHWGSFNDHLIFLISFFGGCTGSTSGGLKAWRFKIAMSAAWRMLVRTGRPSAVLPLHFHGRRVDDRTLGSVYTFLFLYIATFLFGGLCLSLLGYDLRTAFSASIAAVGNVGPGLGPVVGPSGNYGSFPSPALWLLSILMLLGRLELMTVLLLLLPRFWRP